MNSKYHSILYFPLLHEKYHIYPNARQSNLRQLPPPKSAKGKMYLSKSKIPPPSPKKSANKKYFIINFIRLIQKHAIFYLPLPISVTVSIFTISTFISLTLTPNIPTLFIAIPQHTTIIGYRALLTTLHSHFW